MKSILFTTTALVAFAGAAAADVSLSGEASVEYNSDAGYSTAAEMTAAASATLDNGLTASTSFTLEEAGISAGSISLSSDTASLTFGTDVDGAVFTAVGDDYAIGDDGEEGVAEGVVASVTMGETTVTVSAPSTETADVEVGINTTAAGWAIGFGLADGEYAMTAAGTAGGVDVSFGMASDNDYDAGVSYTAGTVTVSGSIDEENAWTVGAAYAADGVSAGFEYSRDANDVDTWEATAGYAADGITVAAAFTDASVMTLGATYDMGNGLTVGAGLEDEDTYAFASYDLGSGANAFVDYTDAAAALGEVGPSERDIATGTTVGVSFTF
jgi:hypothetical protein